MYREHSWLYGISTEKPLVKREESFGIPSIPSKVTVNQLIKSYLCQGMHSPCDGCPSMCRYGREWLQAIRDGRAPKQYYEEVAAKRESAARARMKNADAMADMLRQKGEAQNDLDLIAAAMVMETLSDSNENKREKLAEAHARRHSEKVNAHKRACRDLILLSAYTGYRLHPLSMEKEVFDLVRKTLDEDIHTLELTEEQHDKLRERLKPRVQMLIMRVFCTEKEEDAEI